MKTLISLIAFSFALNTFAQVVKAKRVTSRSEEIRQIEEIIANVNAHGGCAPAQKELYNGKKVDAPKAPFNEPRLLASYCGGTIEKKSSNGYKSVSVKQTRCKNVIVGLTKRYGYFSTDKGEGTRLYQFQFTGLGQKGSQSIRINDEALGYDNDTVVVVTSQSGKSCSYFEANF